MNKYIKFYKETTKKEMFDLLNYLIQDASEYNEKYERGQVLDLFIDTRNIFRGK